MKSAIRDLRRRRGGIFTADRYEGDRGEARGVRRAPRDGNGSLIKRVRMPMIRPILADLSLYVENSCEESKRQRLISLFAGASARACAAVNRDTPAVRRRVNKTGPWPAR